MSERKYDLDWLRVIALVLLILFHVGMLYGTWDYNLKSPRLLPRLDVAMTALSPWRMALIFLISGVACRFLIAKLGASGFALDRLRRLLPPILVGMFLIIPPQTYVELLSKGVTTLDYWTFWTTQYLAAEQTLVAPLHKTMPTWDHLWFLVYLLVYASAFAGLTALARVFGPAPQDARPIWLPLLLIAPALWMAVSQVLILHWTPLTHALVNDPSGHFKWAGFFAVGVMLARQPGFWAFVRARAGTLTLVAAALFAVQTQMNGIAWDVVSGVFGWAAILALCGLAGRFLNQPSPQLRFLNEAVLPVYVLHQPILLVSAFWLFPLRLPLALEAGALAALTLLGGLAITVLLIRPFPPMRFLFGLKSR